MQLSGIASGLDTGNLVSTLVAATRAPAEESIYKKKQSNNAQISALGKLTSALETLKTAATALSTTDDLRSVSASSTNESFSVNAEAANFRGSVNLEVVSKAATHRLASKAIATDDTALGGGSLTIGSVENGSFNVSIDSAASSLDEIAQAINDSADNVGVQASVVKESEGNYKLMLSATSSGTAGALSISVSDDDGSLVDSSGLSSLIDSGSGEFDEISAASDAVLKLDGLTLTRSSNVFDDAIDGLSFDISGTQVGDTTVMTVSEDRLEKKQKVQNFVDAYNDFHNNVSSLSAEGGALRGDSIVRSIASSVRSGFTANVEGLNLGASRLFDVGISIDRYGKADIDDTSFDEKLDADPDMLQKLFAGDGGIASGVLAKLEGFLDSNDGSLQNRQDSILESQKRMDDRLADLDRRMESYESRLRSQFTAMEQVISKFNTMGSFLSGLQPINYQY